MNKRNILLICAALVAGCACRKGEALQPISLSLSTEDVSLSVEGSARGDIALTVSWAGGSENASYSMLMDVAGNDFRNACVNEIGICSGRSVSFSSRELNMLIASHWPEELSGTTSFEIKVRASLGDAEQESRSFIVRISSYGRLHDNLWVIRKSEAGSWSPVGAMTKSEGGGFVWSGHLAPGEIRFALSGDETSDCYGRGVGEGMMAYYSKDGSEVASFSISETGYYRIVLNTVELTASIGLPKIVFLGDSITNNWCRNTTFLADNGFVNFGVSGQTTGQMLQRMKSQVLAAEPDLIVFLGGVNDIAGNDGPVTDNMIITNIRTIASMAVEGGSKIVLCSILPINDIYWNKSVDIADARERILAVNGMITQLCFEEGYGFCDYYNAMKDGKGGIVQSYTKDGLHPNNDGYAVMEPLVLNAIRKTLEN